MFVCTHKLLISYKAPTKKSHEIFYAQAATPASAAAAAAKRRRERAREREQLQLAFASLSLYLSLSLPLSSCDAADDGDVVV